MFDEERDEDEREDAEGTTGGAESAADEPSADAEQPEEEQPAAEAPAEEEPVAASEEAPAEEEPPAAAEETPAVEQEPVAAEEPVADAEPTADAEPAAAEPAAEEEPTTDAERPAGEQERVPPQRPGGRRRQKDRDAEPDVIPGAHLEPDLVLEEAAVERGDFGDRAGAEIRAAEDAFAAADGSEEADTEAGSGTEAAGPEQEAIPTTVLELAADARYRATGKRKSAVARVTLRPGTGTYTVNGRELDGYFPRPTLQRTARGPLETAGQAERMDVVAKIHGGGVSSQAGALRHGVARALVEADPNLRSELKRRGFLTRDPRVKERKKAGLKKARKRPQFSKR